MAKRLSKRQRLANTVTGKKVDRLAVALWRHFFVEETTRQGLVEAMTRWQKEFDWDFLKINPRASYHVEDWGNRYAWSGNPTIPPALVHWTVHEAADFRRIDRLDASGSDGRAAPVLADHLGAVGDLRKSLGRSVPLLMTVFTPMSIAADLAGGPQGLAACIRQDRAAVHAGLATIAETFAAFAAQCLEAGADGIFLATTHTATLTNFTAAEYAEFGRPYDLEVLRAAADARFNLLHVCRARALVRELADYPVALLNWDMLDPTNPGLAEMLPLAPGKGLVGGIDRKLLRSPDAEDAIRQQVRAARKAMGGRRLVLGATCVIDTDSRPEMVRAVRQTAERA